MSEATFSVVNKIRMLDRCDPKGQNRAILVPDGYGAGSLWAVAEATQLRSHIADLAERRPIDPTSPTWPNGDRAAGPTRCPCGRRACGRGGAGPNLLRRFVTRDRSPS